jgi:hypothetical protein
MNVLDEALSPKYISLKDEFMDHSKIKQWLIENTLNVDQWKIRRVSSSC